MRKKILCLAVAVILSICCSVCPVWASVGGIQSVKRLDITDGRIAGEKAGFYFHIPDTWQDKIIIEREVFTTSSKILEKINFYCQSSNKFSQPIYLMSLLVYEKKNWEENLMYAKVLDTKSYIFAVYLAAPATYSNKTDRIVYNFFASQMADLKFVASLIEPAESEVLVGGNRIVVNGKVLKSNVIPKDGGLYLPLRDVCEALGYTVEWESGQVVVKKGNFSHVLNLEGDSFTQHYGATVINGTTYVTDIYFISVLKANVESDSKGNIYIVQ